MLKFRTMRTDAENNGEAKWAEKDDPRVTRVGRWLRRFRVDELPQIINVLRGEMGVVGPRPERPQFVAQLGKELPWYGLRALVPPGITGWAQIRYPYAATVGEQREKLQYDLYYVKNLSVRLDLVILFHTAKVVLFGRGAR
jgi:lipopolysaccharide/colanic/teichoic acid biosynthesis glycosyltransferase